MSNMFDWQIITTSCRDPFQLIYFSLNDPVMSRNY